MSRKRFTAEQVIGILREVDVKLSQGRSVCQVCRDMEITEQTYYRIRWDEDRPGETSQGFGEGEWPSQESGSGTHT